MAKRSLTPGKKKMEERERIPTDILAIEAARISAFCMTQIKNVGHFQKSVPVSEVFEAYVKWRRHHIKTACPLSVDGFGRMLPKIYQRRTIHRDGGTARYVVGVELAC